MSVIRDLFQPLLGQFCWQVEQGYGSFITLEFGEPHLQVHEPHQPTEQAPESVRRNAARRKVYVYGDGHLWVYLADWRIYLRGEELASHASSRRRIHKAALELDGQALTSIAVSSAMVSVFEFDLGGRLEVIPNRRKFKKDADLWLLYEGSGYVFTLRADGQYCHMSGDTPPDKHKWQPLRIPDALEK